ncbi:hypothetical protein ACFQS3_02385 [Glycomyces mayteni]|uniref:Uncharacterized protein n=1 Tax=Glycomyces mayteni TaxID=543887 RepID=A0ABW2D5U5_9ACTN|nr:hypothetical protein GCM10025732_47750 [Glycomyces mayteni]
MKLHTLTLDTETISRVVDALELAEANERYENFISDVKTDLPDQYAAARVEVYESAEGDGWVYGESE